MVPRSLSVTDDIKVVILFSNCLSHVVKGTAGLGVGQKFGGGTEKFGGMTAISMCCYN